MSPYEKAAIISSSIIGLFLIIWRLLLFYKKVICQSADENQLLVKRSKSSGRLSMSKDTIYYIPLYETLHRLSTTPYQMMFIFENTFSLLFKDKAKCSAICIIELKIIESIETLKEATKRYGIDRLTTKDLYNELFEIYFRDKIIRAASTINSKEVLENPTKLRETIFTEINERSHKLKAFDCFEIVKIQIKKVSKSTSY